MRRARYFLMVILTLPALGNAQNLTLSKACSVHSEPQLSSRIVCQKKPGTAFTLQSKPLRGFVEADFGDCEGYISQGCLVRRIAKNDDEEAPQSAPPARGAGRRIAEIETTREPLRLGLQLGGDGFLGTVPYEGAMSTGYGISVGLDFIVPVGDGWRIHLAPQYQFLRVSHGVDGSGYVSNPSPTVYSQSVSYFGGTALAGFRLAEDSSGGSTASYWLDAGGQYLVPIGDTVQTNSLGQTVTFATADSPAFLMAGPSVQFAFVGNLAAEASLFGTFNVKATDGNNLFGLRLALAIALGL